MDCRRLPSSEHSCPHRVSLAKLGEEEVKVEPAGAPAVVGPTNLLEVAVVPVVDPYVPVENGLITGNLGDVRMLSLSLWMPNRLKVAIHVRKQHK